jgi:hypothetical protein
LPVEELQAYRLAVKFRRAFPQGIAGEREAAAALAVENIGEAAAVPGWSRFFQPVPGARLRVRSDPAALELTHGEKLDSVYLPESETASPFLWRRAVTRILAGTTRPFISQGRLAELVGVSVSSVRRYLETLTRSGNIEDTGVEFPGDELGAAWSAAVSLSRLESSFVFVKREQHGRRTLYRLYRRLPNTYERPDLRVRRGTHYAQEPAPLPWEKIEGKPGRWTLTAAARARFFFDTTGESR